MWKVIVTSFIFRLLDNTLSTMKSIYLHKGMYVVSALLNAGSTFFYVVAMKDVITNDSFAGVIAMVLATFLGSIIPSTIINKFEKDKLYVFEVTSNSFEEGIKFADEIRQYGIPIKTLVAYNEGKDRVLSCKIYCSSKSESLVVKNVIPKDFKYNAYTPREF